MQARPAYPRRWRVKHQMNALLLDLDGTIIDSDPVHAAVFIDLMAEHGRPMDESFYYSAIHGRHNDDIFGDLLPDADPTEMSLLKEARYRERIAEVTLIAGLHGAIDRARDRGWRVGIVTNAPRANADAAIDAFNLHGLFDSIVIGDECERGKPDPLPYLTGLAQMGAGAERSIAVEDSPAGLSAARGAGIYTFGMRSGLDAAALIAAGAQDTLQDYNDNALLAKMDRLTGATQ